MGIQGEFAQQSAVFCDDAHVVAGDQEHDWLAAVLIADMEVAEEAEIAEGDAAAGIEAITANAVVDLRLSR